MLLTNYDHSHKKCKSSQDEWVEENRQNFQKFFVGELDKIEAKWRSLSRFHVKHWKVLKKKSIQVHKGVKFSLSLISKLKGIKNLTYFNPRFSIKATSINQNCFIPPKCSKIEIPSKSKMPQKELVENIPPHFNLKIFLSQKYPVLARLRV